jgi:transcriptional regulator GlxA family with amidase domain
MEGHRCSVHWCYDAAFRAEFPQIEAATDVIVMDRRRFTVSGSGAAFDLSLRLIENALGPEISHEVACWFQHPLMRGEGVRQAMPLHPTAEAALPDLVNRAIQLFIADLEEARSINDIAKSLEVTPRQVERAFKKALGQSPSHYFRTLRMKAARQLVQYSKDGMAEIAQAVGYASVAPLQRHYRAAFGVTPAADRAQINAFRVQGQGPLPHS